VRNLLIYLIPFFVTASGFCQSVNIPIYRNLKNSFEEYIDGSVEPIYTPMSYKIIWKNEVLIFIEGSKGVRIFTETFSRNVQIASGVTF